MKIEPFEIDILQEVLDDLRERLKRTRWSDEVEGAAWDYGTNREYLKELVGYWQQGYDWREQEAKLNQFAQFRAEIDGIGIHLVHERGKGPNPFPLILFHGWPDSFYRYHKIIPMLTDPKRFGADSADSFDVIVPSLLGFGFSDRPTARGWTLAKANELWAKLMSQVLGYKRYGAVGGDTGSSTAQLLGNSHRESVVGIHITDLGRYSTAPNFSNLSEEDKQYLGTTMGWLFQEGAYALMQSTKPQTLAASLNDSAAGLASWIVEKFRAWSDCDDDVERKYTKDELLTNIMIYWVTQTIGSSMRAYYEENHKPSLPWEQHIDVPVGMAVFPKDIPQGPSLPRSLAERILRVEHWTVMPRGGHFAAMEEPELLANDLREFFREFRRQ